MEGSSAPRAGEKILVCVGPGPHAARLVRAGRRMAADRGASWTAVHVETPAHAHLPTEDRDWVREHLRLAESLGGESVRLSGESVCTALLVYARAQGVTRILVGKPTHPRWRDFLGGSLLDEIIRHSGDVEVYATSGETEEGPHRPPRTYLPRSPLSSYLWSVVTVAAATVVAWLMFGHFQTPDLALIYLLATVVVATRYGRGPSMLAATLGVALFDFCFVPPYFKLSVHEDLYWLTFLVMLVVGLTVGTLATRLREQAEETKLTELRARAEELRNSLLSSVSHDLRTPLATIMGAATALMDERGVLSSPQRTDLARAIYEEAERLNRLVANLLAITRVESKDLQLRREWVPLEEIVGAALERISAPLVDRPVRTWIPEDLSVLVDAILLEQVFVNLLENAVRHTPPGTSIEIAASLHDATAEVAVIDDGPGLPPGLEQRVFEKFFRASSSSPGGSGLGLAICRGIVIAHGGSIAAANRPEGGVSFTFTLPARRGAPAVPEETPHAREGAA